MRIVTVTAAAALLAAKATAQISVSLDTDDVVDVVFEESGDAVEVVDELIDGAADEEIVIVVDEDVEIDGTDGDIVIVEEVGFDLGGDVEVIDTTHLDLRSKC